MTLPCWAEVGAPPQESQQNICVIAQNVRKTRPTLSAVHSFTDPYDSVSQGGAQAALVADRQQT